VTKKPGNYNAAQSVQLECGDVLWFRVALPQTGEKVWCRKCDEYVTVGQPSHVTVLGFFPDYMWTCTKEGREFLGRCVHDNECGFMHAHRDWTTVKKRMEKHHLHVHAGSALIFTTVERPMTYDHTDATPPF